VCTYKIGGHLSPASTSPQSWRLTPRSERRALGGRLPWKRPIALNLEAGVGIEPAYTALQAVDSAFNSMGYGRKPLRQPLRRRSHHRKSENYPVVSTSCFALFAKPPCSVQRSVTPLAAL